MPPVARPWIRRALRWGAGTLLAASVATLVSFRAGWIPLQPSLLAALVSFTAIASVAAACVAAVTAVRGPRRVAPAAEALAASGLVAIAVGGLANWALGAQGAVVLFEREPVRLSRAEDLAGFDPGPLADPRELDLVVALARLELEGAGPDGFRVVSRLRVLQERTGEEVALVVQRGSAARFTTLLFRQGAFGFAPRIVVEKEGRLVLDARVPFRTVRQGSDGVSFLGEFEIGAEKLAFRGAVTLEDLNDDMKGHPRLELAAEHDGRSLGSGVLRPGESASLGDGYRATFAGLRRWSEIDFARRNYPAPMIAGVVAFLAGAVLWPLAGWRRW